MQIQASQIHFLQSVFGLLAFVLLFFRVILPKKLAKPHHLLSFLIFTLIFGHLAAYVFFVKKIKGIFDPYYPVTDLCLLCKNVIYPEYFVNFGRIALWLIVIAVVFKKLRPQLHLLNYPAFYLVALHALLLGDSSWQKIYWGGTILVTLAVLIKFFHFIIARASSRKI